MYYYCLTPPNFQSKYVFDEKFQQNYYLSKICSIFGKRRPTDFFRSMTGREYSLGKIKQAASTKRKTRKKDTRGFVFQMYCKFYSVYLEHFSSSINILFLQSGFFYYVFKFEQTPTYYARLDVVVLREFYPTFDSITIFAELPLGQGIFFLCCSKQKRIQ